MRIALESQARKARELHTPVGRLSVSPQSRSLFSALFDCSRVLEYAKIRTVLQSTNKAKIGGMTIPWTILLPSLCT